MMSGIWKATVVLVALAAIGCGAAADNGTTPAKADPPEERARRFTEAQKAPLVQPQEDLLKLIGDLEAQLQALQWTEQDAIAIVQSKLRERLVACEAHSHDLRLEELYSVRRYSTDWAGGCGLSRSDPLLKTLITLRDRLQNGSDKNYNVAPRFRKAIGHRALEKGEWSAVHEPTAFRWRVESILPQGGTQFLHISFYAYEKTGLVEGIPTPQQSFGTVEDRLRRLRESKLMEEGAAPATK